MSRSVLDELIERGIINRHEQDGKTVLALTNEEGIREQLDKEPTSIYIGFDPSGITLHVGHLLPIMTLAHFQRFGHKPIILIGGATGMIGDPSGRSDERQLLSPEEVEENVKAIRAQLERFVSFEGDNAAVVVNNEDWIGKISFLEWLRDVGKHFSVNYMLSKESVRKRLEDRETGITYTEFSYMTLQAYDFYHLFTTMGCKIQGGGSDQWGNITAGTDLIRRRTGESAYGITYPLVTTASGEKFGKSAGNAVWLAPEWTSPFAFYQFWLGTNDKDVEKYLKFFSFMSLEEIKEVCRQHSETPEKRFGQKQLANEITKAVHGEDGLATAIQATQVLFGSSLEGLSENDLLDIFKDVPSTVMARDRLEQGLPLLDLLVEAGVSKSKGEGRRLIKGGGLSLNNQKVDDVELTLGASSLATESLLVVRAGKKRFFLVRFER